MHLFVCSPTSTFCVPNSPLQHPSCTYFYILFSIFEKNALKCKYFKPQRNEWLLIPIPHNWTSIVFIVIFPLCWHINIERRPQKIISVLLWNVYKNKKKKKLVRKLWSNYRHVVIGYRALWFLLVGTTTDDLISVQSHASYLAFESVYIRPRKDRGQQMLEMRTLWQKPLSHGIKRRQPRGEIEWQWKNFKGKRSRALYFQF